MNRVNISSLLALAALTTCSISACSSDPSPPPPARDCSTVVWIAPSSTDSSVGLTGSWNGWQGVSIPTRSKDGWRYAYFQLPPGEYGYMIVEDGVEHLDERNPLTTYRGEQQVSWLRVDDCSAPAIHVDGIERESDGGAVVRLTFLTSSSGAKLDPTSVEVRTLQPGRIAHLDDADPSTGRLTVHIPHQPQGKTTIVVTATDERHVQAEPARTVWWEQPAADDWRDGLLYQVMVDRYRGDGATALASPKTPGSRAGGTLDGIKTEIERGYFDSLGVTALWLSPVVRNPDEPREGRGDGHLYEGYHGYWPLESRRVDYHLGTSEEFRDLVHIAHNHGLKVILDVVPNHVYEKNITYVRHQRDGWFHDGPGRCVCGAHDCGWDTHIQTCWFTPYLPDYNWKNPAVANHVSDEISWWTDTYDLDGVRIDAVPMMPRSASRRIISELRAGQFPQDSRFMLGEVYTGPGEEGIKQIRYYLGPAGLDSAFDFPLMWTLWDVIGRERGSFENVEHVWDTTGVQFANSGAVIARMIDNHDTKRFISVANGDADGDPWNDPPVQPAESLPYDKLKIALALLLTSPGLPLIYYGDEVGLAGGSDPDCRRVMPAPTKLNDHQRSVRTLVRTLGRLRRCSRALRRGERVKLHVDEDTYAYLRDIGDGSPVLVALSKATTTTHLTLRGNVIPPGNYRDVLSGESISLGAESAGATLEVAPWQVRVLLRADDDCLSPDGQSK